ncbi:MAG: ABC transporter ATP-binding protein [Proteobacteria bacterium]|nr:ABC transporter ATP-binding protein [Pseudomonadota bacterium]
MSDPVSKLRDSDPTLLVKNLNVDIAVPAGTLHAVTDVSFHVDRGETLCIVGESGCGKSITSLAVMGLLPRKATLTATTLSLEGVDLMSLKERDFSNIRGNRMGMIFQDPMTSLNPVYTIGNQMEEIYTRHGKGTRQEAKDRAEYLLNRVGITAVKSRLGQFPHQLSGGLRQRVMIAMTLMCDPIMIMADEPTTALDVTIQAQILHLLADLQDEFNMALVLITHDLGVVARMADRVAVMYAGRIVEQGTATQVFATPSHPYTQGLLECIPIPGKSEPGSHLGAIKGMVPALVGDQDGCMFRNRCPYVMDACTHGNVPEQSLSDMRSYLCHLGSEQAAINLKSGAFVTAAQ